MMTTKTIRWIAFFIVVLSVQPLSVGPTVQFSSVHRFAASLLLAGPPTPTMSVIAQQPRTGTSADYARAEKMLAQNLNGLVVGGSVTPNWLAPGADDRFWYRNTLADGMSQIILVDPARKTRVVC